MPDKKPDHVDLIQEATRQNLPRTNQRAVIEPEIKDKRRLSHWPPAHIEEWRADLAPWRTRSRRFSERD